MITLTPTVDDYQSLLAGNPQAAAELRAIILARLLAEKDAELVALQEQQAEPETKIIDIKEVSDAT